MQHNPNELLKILLDNDFEFVIIGGVAALIHGSSQVTRDLDICIRMTPDEIVKLRECLKSLHPKHRMTPQKLSFINNPADNLSRIKNLYIQTDAGIIDILSEVAAIGEYAAVEKNAITVKLFQKDCKVMSINDLIKSKQALGRDKDLFVVKELKVIQEKQKHSK